MIIEAGVRMPWQKFLRGSDIFLGVEDFGISAKWADAFQHFGLTKEHILEMLAEW